MLDTRLILIEGFPGAGKTTTAVELGERLQQQGIPSRWHLEEDDPHPIACLDFKLRDLRSKLPPLWRDFTRKTGQSSELHIIESRLWQNTILFMYMSDYPFHDLLELQQLVAAELTALSPVLVYLHQDDVQKAILRLPTIRDEQTLARDFATTRKYPWFRSRDLADLDGWVQFFSEWAGVAEALYLEWPHHKQKVLNAHEDWERAIQQIFQGLGL